MIHSTLSSLATFQEEKEKKEEDSEQTVSTSGGGGAKKKGGEKKSINLLTAMVKSSSKSTVDKKQPTLSTAKGWLLPQIFTRIRAICLHPSVYLKSLVDIGKRDSIGFKRRLSV